MNLYRATVTFAGDDHAFIIWQIEAITIEFLIDDVVKKLRRWLGAKGVYLKKAGTFSYEIRLATISLGWIEIEEVQRSVGINFTVGKGESDDK